MSAEDTVPTSWEALSADEFPVRLRALFGTTKGTGLLPAPRGMNGNPPVVGMEEGAGISCEWSLTETALSRTSVSCNR